jgi:vacuolar-type H+-ATPase subunit I/STV1
VNATKLCAKFEKQFKEWLRNQSSKDLIEELALAGILATATVNGGLQELQSKITGTYVHKLLIPQIASWISPSVGIKVSQIVNEFVLSEKLREKDRMLHEKDDKIDELLHDMKEVIQQNEEFKSQIGELKTLNEEIKDDVDIVSTKLDVATDQRVVPFNDKRDEVFMLFNIGNNLYYTCRIQKLQRNRNIDKYGSPILEVDHAKTVNLLLHIKEDEALRGRIKCYRNTIHIIDTRINLAEEIRRVDREKKTM